jgi:hypothetical protein
VFVDHALREFCDIGLIEFIGPLQIDFLDVEEFPMTFDFVANAVAVELGPGA